MVVLIVVFLFKNKRGLCVLLIFCLRKISCIDYTILVFLTKNAGIGDDLFFCSNTSVGYVCSFYFLLAKISCTDYVILFSSRKTLVLVMTCFSVQKQAWVFLVVVFLFRFALLLLLLDDTIIIAIIIATISTTIKEI